MSFGNDMQQLSTSFVQSCTEEDREIYLKNNSDDEEQTDNSSEHNQDSDTEQDLSSSEEDIILPNTDPLEETYTGRDGVTKWSSQYHWTNDTIKSEKAIIDTPGVKPVACDAKTIIDCWKLFISDGMIDQILHHTNVEIKKRILANKEQPRGYILKEATKEELLALFGLIYISGLYSSCRQNLSDLWSMDGTGVEIFRTTMSLQRFHFLQNCLRFEDETTRKERKKIDNLAPIRTIFEEFVSNCQNNYSPSEYLTIDEKLLPFRGACPFRTYFPKNPANYGIKLYALVDSKVYYTVNLEIYPGKQPDGPYLQSNETFHVVDRLVQPISNTKKNVTFDKKITSIPLILHLLHNHNLTSLGIINKNKKEIPSCFIKYRKHAEDIPKFAFQRDLTLVSYKPKKTKVVLALSSLHHDQRMGPTSGNKLKPEIITSYETTKSGVNVVDKLCAMYNVSRNSKHWTMTIFYAIMNLAAINSLIIYRENNKTNTNRREFIRKLALAMIEGHLFTRKNKDTLPRELRKRIHEQIGENIVYEKSTAKYQRCKDCQTSKDRKTKYTCTVCNKPICLQHVVTVCKNCIDYNSD